MTPRLMTVCAVTHRGRHKARNEDTVVMGDWASSVEAGVPTRATLSCDDGPMLVAVCDGMGGHAAGDEASALAAARLRTYRQAFGTADGARQVLTAIGVELSEWGRRDPARRGMGTTATVLAVMGDTALVTNIGDSPAYEYAGGALRELTISDEMVRPDGTIAGSVLTQSLGPHGSDIEVHVLPVDLRETPSPGRGPGDDCGDGAVDGPGETGEAARERVFLLCSDGLSDFVSLGAMEGLIAAAPHPVQAVPALLDAALAAGGWDNISIAIAAVRAADASL